MNKAIETSQICIELRTRHYCEKTAATEPNLAVMVSGGWHASMTYNFDSSKGTTLSKCWSKILNIKGFQLSLKVLTIINNTKNTLFKSVWKWNVCYRAIGALSNSRVTLKRGQNSAQFGVFHSLVCRYSSFNKVNQHPCGLIQSVHGLKDAPQYSNSLPLCFLDAILLNPWSTI